MFAFFVQLLFKIIASFNLFSWNNSSNSTCYFLCTLDLFFLHSYNLIINHIALIQFICKPKMICLSFYACGNYILNQRNLWQWVTQLYNYNYTLNRILNSLTHFNSFISILQQINEKLKLAREIGMENKF